MRELGTQLVGAWHDTSGTEVFAAVLAVLYVVLAIKQRLSCWAVSFVSSCLYVVVLFNAHLYMESLLNGFYAAIAIYGFLQWRTRELSVLRVTRWPLAPQAAGAAVVLCLALLTSYFLRRFTPAAWPFVDSLVAWSSVFTTYLVARKVYENWHWWLVIDSVSAVLYYTRHLYVTMLVFMMYLVLILIGMREWRRSLPGAPALAASHAI